MGAEEERLSREPELLRAMPKRQHGDKVEGGDMDIFDILYIYIIYTEIV